jgi:hypothetical protein
MSAFIHLMGHIDLEISEVVCLLTTQIPMNSVYHYLEMCVATICQIATQMPMNTFYLY